MRRRFSRSQSPRRKKEWEQARANSGGVEQNPGGDVSTVDCGWIQEPAGRFSPGEGQLIEDDRTLLRTIPSFRMSLRKTGAFSTPAFCNGWAGAGLLAWEGLDGTVTPNILDVPWPIGGAGIGSDADWIWSYVVPFGEVPFVVSNQLGTAVGGESKAKRKLSSGMGILLIVQVEVFSAIPMDYCWDYYHRQLFLKP